MRRIIVVVSVLAAAAFFMPWIELRVEAVIVSSTAAFSAWDIWTTARDCANNAVIGATCGSETEVMINQSLIAAPILAVLAFLTGVIGRGFRGFGALAGLATLAAAGWIAYEATAKDLFMVWGLGVAGASGLILLLAYQFGRRRHH